MDLNEVVQLLERQSFRFENDVVLLSHDGVEMRERWAKRLEQANFPVDKMVM